MQHRLVPRERQVHIGLYTFMLRDDFPYFPVGPCVFTGDNTTEPAHNPHSWNSKASLIYLEQPVGTGFSYAEHGEHAVCPPLHLAHGPFNCRIEHNSRGRGGLCSLHLYMVYRECLVSYVLGTSPYVF